MVYAVSAEIQLDKLEIELESVFVRAYADDTALLLKNFTTDAPKLATIFEEFEQVSGLRLNMKKSVIIPLNSSRLQGFTSLRNRIVPQWKDMPIKDHCKYLGYMVGPGRKDHSWLAPYKKFQERIKLCIGMPESITCS